MVTLAVEWNNNWKVYGKYDYKELAKICPIVYDFNDSIEIIWGKYVEIYKAYANDLSVNLCTSFGGVNSAMLIWMLELRIIDAVIHIGVSGDNPN